MIATGSSQANLDGGAEEALNLGHSLLVLGRRSSETVPVYGEELSCEMESPVDSRSGDCQTMVRPLA